MADHSQKMAFHCVTKQSSAQLLCYLGQNGGWGGKGQNGGTIYWGGCGANGLPWAPGQPGWAGYLSIPGIAAYGGHPKFWIWATFGTRGTVGVGSLRVACLGRLASCCCCVTCAIFSCWNIGCCFPWINLFWFSSCSCSLCCPSWRSCSSFLRFVLICLRSFAHLPSRYPISAMIAPRWLESASSFSARWRATHRFSLTSFGVAKFCT